MLADNERHERDGVTLLASIYYDQDCSQPFEGDDGVRIVILHRHYGDPSEGGCGRDGDSVREWAEANAADWFVAPLFMYEHSGVALSTGDFGDPWDSGQVGIVALKRSEWGNGQEDAAKFGGYASGVAREFGEWMNGECYGYRIARVTEDEHGDEDEGRELDSCWGFVGGDAVRDAIKDALPHCFEQAKAQRDAELEAAARDLEASRPDMYGNGA